MTYFLDMRHADDLNAGAPGTMLCVLNRVREHGHGEAVELWRTLNGRLVIRAYNECGNASTYVDLWDLLEWLQTGSGTGLLEAYAGNELT